MNVRIVRALLLSSLFVFPNLAMAGSGLAVAQDENNSCIAWRIVYGNLPSYKAEKQAKDYLCSASIEMGPAGCFDLGDLPVAR